MTLKSFALAALAATVFVTAAAADPVTFKFEGDTWTITNKNINGVSRVDLTPGFKNACPQLRVRLEATTKGDKRTRAQKFRGDPHWHVLCDRSAPPEAATVVPDAPPPATHRESAPRQRSMRRPPADTMDVRFQRM